MIAHPGISLVVPHRNLAAYLVECVASIHAQEPEAPYEVVVVDDASDAPDVPAALRDVGRDPRVRVVAHASAMGVQLARETGVRRATFDLVLPLDADDALESPNERAGGFAQTAYDILTRRPECAFVHTGSRMFGAVEGTTISSYPLDEQLVARKHHVPTSIVYRRADALAGARYDPAVRKWQDWSFGVDLLATRRARGLGTAITFVPGNLHRYRIHEGPGRTSSQSEDELAMVELTVRRRREFFRHWHPDCAPEHLAERVLAAKPTRLEDLLRMAHHDLEGALSLVEERSAQLHSAFDGLGVP
jgi:glycosyltransferase involved in cell wall biosynthesis